MRYAPARTVFGARRGFFEKRGPWPGYALLFLYEGIEKITR